VKAFPIEQVRREFPALDAGDGRRVYFDAPGGTQACRAAIEGMGRAFAGGDGQQRRRVRVLGRN
jgi:selenocysteine lyase/cysteine desulfurase